MCVCVEPRYQLNDSKRLFTLLKRWRSDNVCVFLFFCGEVVGNRGEHLLLYDKFLGVIGKIYVV